MKGAKDKKKREKRKGREREQTMTRMPSACSMPSISLSMVESTLDCTPSPPPCPPSLPISLFATMASISSKNIFPPSIK